MFNRYDHSNKFPCYRYPGGQCPNRHPGCQDVCLEMLAAQLVHSQERKKVKEGRARINAADGCNIDMANRKQRKKTRQI